MFVGVGGGGVGGGGVGGGGGGGGLLVLLFVVAALVGHFGLQIVLVFNRHRHRIQCVWFMLAFAQPMFELTVSGHPTTQDVLIVDAVDVCFHHVLQTNENIVQFFLLHECLNQKKFPKKFPKKFEKSSMSL
jgi:hypothetical protein